MALFVVSPEKEKQLISRMRALGIQERDLEEQFVRSSGAGGQKVNKTSTCVMLHHRPTGIRVKCQKERSQALNRFLARRILLDKIEAKLAGAQSAEKTEDRKDPSAKKTALPADPSFACLPTSATRRRKKPAESPCGLTTTTRLGKGLLRLRIIGEVVTDVVD